MTMGMHEMGLYFAQCVVLQVMEEQRPESDEDDLDASDCQQHFQQDQLQVGEFQQNGQRQNDLPLLALVSAIFLFARLFNNNSII